MKERLEELRAKKKSGELLTAAEKAELMELAMQDWDEKYEEEHGKPDRVHIKATCRFTFGKHKGKNLNNIPLHYLDWAHSNMKFRTYQTSLKMEIGKILQFNQQLV